MRTLLLCAVAAVCACERAPAPQDTPAPADPAPAAEAQGYTDTWPSAVGAPVRVRQQRRFDITGDDAAERFVVTATGTHHDSLDIVLHVETAGGETLWLDRWSSAAYFENQVEPLPDSTRHRIVREHVEELLADHTFRESAEMADEESITFHLAELDWRRSAGLEPRDPTPPGAYDRIAARPAAAERARAVLEEVRAGRAFTYYAGGEASYAIGWSDREHAIIRLFSCC